GQIGAQIAAGRQRRFDLPGFDDVDDRARFRVALSEQEHVEGPVGGHADEVRLDQARSHPRGGAREPAPDPQPCLRTGREPGGRWPGRRGRAHRPAPAKAETATPSDSRRARAARAMSIEPCESPWKQPDSASAAMRLATLPARPRKTSESSMALMASTTTFACASSRTIALWRAPWGLT